MKEIHCYRLAKTCESLREGCSNENWGDSYDRFDLASTDCKATKWLSRCSALGSVLVISQDQITHLGKLW
ncbi:Uncharacterized protein HZ326_17587 [Fusarium oxysporum f. sp. albedinis]|nr:Uncharacterized protein HZ326_17587 [Fusarium oxysporum f. sp. albedinis]